MSGPLLPGLIAFVLALTACGLGLLAAARMRDRLRDLHLAAEQIQRQLRELRSVADQTRSATQQLCDQLRDQANELERIRRLVDLNSAATEVAAAVGAGRLSAETARRLGGELNRVRSEVSAPGDSSLPSETVERE